MGVYDHSRIFPRYSKDSTAFANATSAVLGYRCTGFQAGQSVDTEFRHALETNGFFQAYIKVKLLRAAPSTSASKVIDKTYLPQRHPHPLVSVVFCVLQTKIST